MIYLIGVCSSLGGEEIKERSIFDTNLEDYRLLSRIGAIEKLALSYFNSISCEKSYVGFAIA